MSVEFYTPSSTRVRKVGRQQNSSDQMQHQPVLKHAMPNVMIRCPQILRRLLASEMAHHRKPI